MNIRLHLSRINRDQDLKKLVPNAKIRNAFLGKGASLYDIYSISESAFIKIDGVGKPSIPHLIEMKRDFEINLDFYQKYYDYMIQDYILVSDVMSDNMFDFMIKIIKKTVDCLDYKFTYFKQFFSNSKLKQYNNLLSIIKGYFGIDSPIKNYSEIALDCGYTPERVRQLLLANNNKPDLSKFFQGEEFYGVKLSQKVINKINQYLKDHLYLPNFIDEFTVHQEDNQNAGELCQRILNLFNHNLADYKITDYRTTYFLVEESNVLNFKKHCTLFDSTFRTTSKSFTFQEFEKVLKESNKKNIPLSKEIIDALINYHPKVDSFKENSIKYYRFKWQFLSSKISKVERILKEVEHPLSKNDIVIEFNKLAKKHGLSLVNDIYLKSTNFIIPIGKTGMWTHKSDVFLKDSYNFQEYLNTLIIEEFNGKVQIKELLEFIDNSKFAKIYPNSTINAYIQTICRPVVSDDNLFIHENYLSKYYHLKTKPKRNKYFGNTIFKLLYEMCKSNSNEAILKKDIVNEITDILKISEFNVNNKGNIGAYIETFIDDGYILEEKKGESFFLKVNQRVVSNLDIEKIGKKSRPHYHDIVISKAKKYLKYSTVKETRLSLLKNALSKYIPSGISPNIIYKIIENEDAFIKTNVDRITHIRLALD